MANILEFMERLISICEKENAFDRSGNQPVIRFKEPSKLKEEMSLSLTDEPANEKEINTLIQQIIRYSVQTSNPHFHSEFYGGIDGYGLIGSLLTEILNTSQHNSENAPVLTLIEREVLSKSLKLIGYSPTSADGIFCPGSNISNAYGMMMAMFKKKPEYKENGICAQNIPLACFTSRDSNNWITKTAQWLGIGNQRTIFKVETDVFGCMKVESLQECINDAKGSGLEPFFVNATVGTPINGATDPIKEISDICEKQNLWLHIDASHGGSLLLSKGYQDQLKHFKLSNSVTWSPHNFLGVPLQCSIFMVQDKKLWYRMNSVKTNDSSQTCSYSDLDISKNSLQCSRKVEAMKFWLMWKAHGTDGLKKLVDQALHCGKYFLDLINKTPGFRVLNFPRNQAHHICFWYIPPSLRNMPEDVPWMKKLNKATITILERMVKEGSLMIGYSWHSYYMCHFFRMVVNCQPRPTESSMNYAIDQIVKFGKDL